MNEKYNKLVICLIILKDNKLDYSKLLDASEYKEKFRADMIQWGEDKRQADPGYFCRIVAESQGSDKPIWLISDCRRRSDVEYFQTNYPGRTFSVRVSADNNVRQSRGWVFTPGIVVSHTWILITG